MNPLFHSVRKSRQFALALSLLLAPTFVQTSSAAPSATPTTDKYPYVRVVVGQEPIPITAKDVDDKEFSFEQYKGKVVLMDFWATWCGPCIADMPNVKAAYAKYKQQGFDVIGISLDKQSETVTKYIAENKMPWRQVVDGGWQGPISTSYNVRSIPMTILIGKDGKIAGIGLRGEALEPAIKAALAK